MIRKLIKISTIVFLLVIMVIFYLSLIGIKTEKFNEGIINKISKINKRINLDLVDVKFLLNPSNFTVNITTKDPTVLLGSKKLKIKEIKTNISLKSLITNEFSVDDLKLSTKFIKLDDLILLAKSFKNSPELFLLDSAIKGGLLTVNASLQFDKNGNIKKNYQITGIIKNTKLNFLNQIKVSNLSLQFDIQKNKFSLMKIKSKINGIQLSSPLIKINKKKDQFFVTGKILTNQKEFNRDQINIMNVGFLKDSNIEKIRFKSENDISFNINKRLKVKDLEIQSKVNLDKLIIKNNFMNLKLYLPSIEKLVNFENHKISINYGKDKLNIRGNGKFFFKDKFDSINYEVIKNDNKFIFNTKTNFKNNKLLIDFLDY